MLFEAWSLWSNYGLIMQLVFDVASGGFYSHFLDLFPFSDDGFVSPEVDIRRCDVAQTFMVTLVVVILDECPDLTFKIAG